MFAIIQIAFNKFKRFIMNSNNRFRRRGNIRMRGRKRLQRNNNRRRILLIRRNNMKFNKFRGMKRRTRLINNGRARSQPISNNNNKNNLTKVLNNKINELKNDISKLKLIDIKDPKINSTKKEIRKDKLVDASIMAKYSKMLAFYKTPSKIIKYCAYNKYTINFNRKSIMIWFPYGYPMIHGKVKNVNADGYCNFYGYSAGGQWYITPTRAVNIKGNYRLISATMKIANVTSVMDREGTFSVVKETEREMYPLVYSSDNALTPVTAPAIVGNFQYILNQTYTTTTERQLYSASDKAKIVEYNVSEGLNIFQGYEEYMGMQPDYDNEENRYYVTYNKYNPIGQNFKYIFMIDQYTKEQAYSFESWQIFEIRPESNSNYASIATVGDEIFSKEAFQQAKGENNFKIEKL